MIKHTEVRIGNLVRYEDRVFKINVISEELPGLDTEEYGIGVVTWKDLEPILINKEWLWKFGFTSNTFNWSYDDFRISKIGDAYNIGFKGILLVRHAKHIHLLQNLIFDLTQKELKT